MSRVISEPGVVAAPALAFTERTRSREMELSSSQDVRLTFVSEGSDLRRTRGHTAECRLDVKCVCRANVFRVLMRGQVSYAEHFTWFS